MPEIAFEAGYKKKKSGRPMCDLSGQVFGKLKVISISGFTASKNAVWKCMCECGTEKNITSTLLRRGSTVSCGCHIRKITKERSTTHGMSNSSEWRAWSSMRSRCCDKNHNAYCRYGGRGIKVCDQWLNSFEQFFADVGKKPPGDYSIDRINNAGNYEPGNVRWATRKEQQSNRRSNVLLTLNGETNNATEWARKIGVSRKTILNRKKRGMSDADILSIKRWERS